MNKIFKILSDSSLSLDRIKEALNIDETFPTTLSDKISFETVTHFLQGKLNYVEASTIINHLFIIWMSKPYKENFGKISWFVHVTFDKADEYYDEDDFSKSTEVAKKLLLDAEYFKH